MVNGGTFNHQIGQIAMHKTQEGEKQPIKLCIVQQINVTEGPMAGEKMYRVSYVHDGAIHEALLPEKAIQPYRQVH